VVAGVLLVAASIAGGLRLMGAADATVAVLAVTHDLPAGHVVTPADVKVTRIKADGAVLGRLVAGDDARSVTGRVLLFPAPAQGLLDKASLGRAAGAGREITVPVAPEHALGGALRVGDRVDVLATFDKGTETARTITVAHRAQVVELVHGDGLFGQHEGALQALTVSVGDDDAVLVAFALRNGEIDVVRATGGDRAARDQFDVSDLP
jgi:hypothetical protein